MAAISLLVSIVIAVRGFNFRAVKGAGSLFALSILLAICSATNILGVLSTTIEAKHFFSSFQFMVGAAGGLIFYFSFRYCFPQRKINPLLMAVLIFEPVLTLALALTDQWHGLMRLDTRLVLFNGFRLVPGRFGLWFWVDMVYGCLLYFLAAAFLTITLLRTPKVYRRQVSILLAGLGVPSVVLVLLLSGITQIYQTEYHIAILSLSNLILAWGVFSRQLGSILPFARDMVMHYSTQGIVLADRNHTVLDSNRAARAIFNLEATPDPPRKLDELLPVDIGAIDAAWAAQAKDRPGGQGGGETNLTQHIQVDGRDLLLFFSPVKGPVGELLGWIVMIHDTTELRRLEKALVESELLHHSVAENADEGIMIIQDGLVIYANSRLANLGGYDRNTVLGSPFTRFFVEEERAKLESQYLRRIGSGDAPDLFETKVLCQDGRQVEVEINASRIDYRGKPAVVAFVRDITTRKQTERELNRAQGQYRSFIEQSLDGFVLLDQNGKVAEWNRAMECITQIDRESAIGREATSLMLQLIPPETLSKDIYERIRSGMAPLPFREGHTIAADLVETIIQRADGTRRVTQQITSPIKTDGGIQLGITIRDVTDLKRAETELRDSERRFEAIADTAPMLIWITNQEGNCTYLSKAWEGFSGERLESLLGIGWTKRCHPDDLPQVWDQLKRAIEEQRPLRMEFRMQNAAGDYRWLLASGTPREELAGQPSGFIGSCLDITEMKEHEDELRGLTRAIEQSPVTVMITDLKGTIEYVNPRFTEVTGYAAEEVIGKNPSILKSGQTPVEEYARLWSTISQGGEWNGILRNKRKNGELYWEQSTISGIYDARGQLTHYLAIMVDITAQKTIEELLQQQKARMDLVFNNPLIGISLLKRDGGYTLVNRQLAAMLGYSTEEMSRLTIKEITHPDDLENNKALLESMYSGVIDHFKIEKRFIRKNGSVFWGEVEVAPIFGPDGKVAETVGFITDISERRAIEEKLRESEELYRSIIHASPDNITITDLDGFIRFASPVALQMFGYSDLSEWNDRKFDEFLIPDERKRAVEWVGNLRAGRVEGVEEFRAFRRDGSTFILEVNADVLKGQNDSPDGLIFISRDITARKALEADQRQRVQQLDALRETMNDISNELDLPRVLEAIAQRVVTLLGVGECEVALYDERQDVLRIVVCLNRDRDYTGVVQQIGEGTMGRAAQTRRTVIIEDYGLWEGRSPQFEPVHRAVICVPLINNQNLLGAVSVSADPDLRPFNVGDIRMIEMFAQQAAVAINNAKLFGEVQRLAATDSLTGLNNRRSFFERARQEFNRSVRYGHKMSVIMLDVDHFKKINDNFGHAAGDEALRVIAGLCMGITRISDVCGRYGGEEFIILLPETSLNGAVSMAQRLCDQISARQIPTERGVVRMTASIGVAEMNGETTDLEQLLEKADQALYRAKQSGRNRVAI